MAVIDLSSFHWAALSWGVGMGNTAQARLLPTENSYMRAKLNVGPETSLVSPFSKAIALLLTGGDGGGGW